MGGGDLNSKKSWHPNTIKNQERVWKAEQAAAEEKKRMVELQRERAEERDRAELHDIMNNQSSSSGSNNRLSWMYDKPDKKVEEEAYLLGKAIDKNSEQAENANPDPIPAVSRRVVGSSMLTATGDAQVDISRKIREDPLLLIKERERAARAALLNNPLQRRRLAELLRKEQDQRNETKLKKKSKKKDKDLDDLLASKLNALGGQKGIDLATLLDSEDSSSDSEDEKSKKKKKKRAKSKTKKKKKRSNSSGNDSDDVKHKIKESRHDDQKSETYYSKSSRKRSSDKRLRSDSPVGTKYYKKQTSDSKQNEGYSRSNKYDDEDASNKYSSHRKAFSRAEREGDRRNGDPDQRYSKKRGGISEEEKAARLAEMVSAGQEREVQRGKRVAEQRAADVAAESRAPAPRASRYDARVLPESLESRIHSNRHYIQRDKRHMNENFARR